MKRTMYLLLGFLLILEPSVGLSEVSEKDKKDLVIPPQKRLAIIKLIKISGTMGAVEKFATTTLTQYLDMMRRYRPEIPPRLVEILEDEMKALVTEQVSESNAFMAYFVPIYDKYFTLSEIDGLISFYESDLGKKAVRVMPQVTEECMLAGEKWGESLGPIIEERIMRRLDEEGIEVNKEK